MTRHAFTRRTVVNAAIVTAGASVLGGAAVGQTLPSAPLVINVIDAAGDLTLTQKIFDNYAKAKPQLVSKFTFTRSPLPELPGKIKAQQDAGRNDIDVVLCGYSGIALGNESKVWMQLLPAHAAALPKPEDVYIDGARVIQSMVDGMAVVIAYTPFGPVFSYHPDKVKNPPTTAEELMAWAAANKNRFFYARPANSGAGLAMLAGMPYILGDANPKDPAKGWDKTWAYLKALGEHIEYYPAGSAPMLKEFGEGSRDMIPTITGFDINTRVQGIVPKEAKITTLKGFHWVSDAHVVCIPRGISESKLAVALDIISYMLTKEQQAFIFDAGYYYPGPAVKGVTLDMAPAESQAVLREFGRPEYDKLIADNPVEPPLDPAQLAVAFRIWDETVGGAKRK
jgi:putative spermidine/putrescine transport system substrate-binding protein